MGIGDWQISEFNRDIVKKNKFNFGEPEIDKATKNINIELGDINPSNLSDNNSQNIKEIEDFNI